MDHSHHDHHHDHGDMTNLTSTIVTTVASVLENTSVADIVSNVSTTIGSMMSHAGHEGHDGHDETISDHVHGMDMGGGHMDMFFKFSLNATILFKEWEVHTTGGMIGSVIGVMIFAILYEGIKFLREYLFRKSYTRLSYSTCAVTGNGGCESNGAELHKVTENKMFGLPHLLQTSLHVVQIVLSYFLMLIFMTFNLWLCFGVLIGSAIGYFLFGWRKSTIVDISDHCH